MMETQEQKSKCRFEIQNHEWYRDIKGRVWVVVGFWYEGNVKDKIYLLQMGHTTHTILEYSLVQREIEAKRMQIITPQ